MDLEFCLKEDCFTNIGDPTVIYMDWLERSIYNDKWDSHLSFHVTNFESPSTLNLRQYKWRLMLMERHSNVIVVSALATSMKRYSIKIESLW